MKNIFQTLVFAGLAASLALFSLDARGDSQAKTEQPASSTKMVTDHAGNRVELPANPQRVASLHTRSTTVMLTELGVPLIGSATVIHEADGRPYIRAAEELLGLILQDTELADYGKKGSDLERIKISKPDLIVGTVKYHHKLYDQLSGIAPTLLVEQTAKDQIQTYKDLASWVGKQDVFTTKHRAYTQRITQVRQRFATLPKPPSFVFALADTDKGKLSVYSVYGGVTTVAYDLGFQLWPYVHKALQDSVRERLSPEVIDELNADYFLSAYSSADSETAANTYEGFDQIAPGWKQRLKSYQQKQFMVFNAELTRPPVFAAYHNVLDEFVRVLK